MDSTAPTIDTAPATQTRSAIRPALLVTLALLAAIAPFATDLYLPAFPEMVSALSTTTTGVQLSLTTFLIGAGVGQVLFGPWSDRIGRQTPLIIGAVVFVASSVLASLAPTIEILIAARLIQGLSGAAGMVIGRAIVSDLEQGRGAARAFSLMMMVGGVAPVIAPFAGSVLAETIGWRGLLWIVSGIGVVALAAVLLFTRETRPAQVRQAAAAVRPKGEVSRELRSRAYLTHTISFGFAFASMMAYISASPFLYQDLMGLSVVQYGLAFGVNAIALMAVSALSSWLTSRFAPRALARTGLLINLGASVAFLLIAVSDLPRLWLAAALLVAVGALGLVFGNATALALGAVPAAAGSASALLGLLQFALAGLVAPLVTIAGETNPLPLALTMLGASAVATAASLASPRAS